MYNAILWIRYSLQKHLRNLIVYAWRVAYLNISIRMSTHT
jgi:hypothetical protein